MIAGYYWGIVGIGSMAQAPPADIAAAIEALKNPCDLDAILACAASHTDECPGGARTGLLHPRFREDVPLVDDLARILADQCVYYALPRRKRLELHEQIKADISKIARTMAVVRDVFVNFNAKHPSRASEVGEVLAYCVAQTHLSAAQMASKMALKTSANMPVHGLDGVHAKFEDGVLSVYFLEAKLASGAQVGALRYAKSAAEFSAKKMEFDYVALGRDYRTCNRIINCRRLDRFGTRVARSSCRIQNPYSSEFIFLPFDACRSSSNTLGV